METLDSNFLESDCIGEKCEMTYYCNGEEVIDTVETFSEVIARKEFSNNAYVLCISTLKCKKCGRIHVLVSDKTIGEQIEEFSIRKGHDYELYIGKTLDEFRYHRIGFFHNYVPCCLTDRYAVHEAGTYSVPDDDEPEDKDNYD